MRRGFTLIELLVVIAIVAVLAAAVIITLNPRELLKQARDSTRISDITVLNKALALYQAQAATTTLGSTTTVFLSIPDSSSTCANLGMGSSFTCVAASTSRSVAGTGWIPVNLGSISGSQSAISVLPIDPINTTSTGLYYTYQAGSTGTWKITAAFESSKYSFQSSNDGGSDPVRLEMGTELSLAAPQGGGAPGSPILWLAADTITGKNNGDSIATWLDSSGSGNNGTGAITLPTYRTNVVNGKPVVRFTNGIFTFPNMMNGLTAAEIFYVIKVPNDGQYNGFAVMGSDTFNSDHYSYYGTVYDGFGSTQRKNAGNPPGVIDTWHIYNVSANSSWVARKNGVQFYSTSNTFGYSTTPRIGWSLQAAFEGDIAEVLLYGSVLTTSTRAGVTSYLQTKYGL